MVVSLSELNTSTELTPAERREQRDGPFGPNNEPSRLVMSLTLPGTIRQVKQQQERTAKGRTSSLMDVMDEFVPDPDFPEDLRGVHGDYDRTDYEPESFRYADLPGFRLAWLIGVCRSQGVHVFVRDGQPRIDAGKNPSPLAAAAVQWLKRYRDLIVTRLQSGHEFDSRTWQLELVFKDAQGWQVWGWNTADGCGHDHGGPLQAGQVPGYIDRITIWRRGAWKWFGSRRLSGQQACWVSLPRTGERGNKSE